MTDNKLRQLKAIADRLALRSNDPAAVDDFQQLVKTFTPAERRDLVAVLQDMIADARRQS
jgi:hypothetical protein